MDSRLVPFEILLKITSVLLLSFAGDRCNVVENLIHWSAGTEEITKYHISAGNTRFSHTTADSREQQSPALQR